MGDLDTASRTQTAEVNRLCLILFGPPASGKGAQAQLLRKALGAAHISTGEMLREHVAAADDLGHEVAAIMHAGGLVPDELVNRMVAERIEHSDCAAGFILDGYPRTVSQARLMAQLLAERAISAVVVHLKVDYNVIIGRVAGRRHCPSCGAVYSVSSSTGAVAKFCDLDGSKLAIRDDDRPEVVKERLKAYERQTAPVLDFLRDAGYPILDIDGAAGPPPVIARQIEKLVREAGPQPSASGRILKDKQA